MGKKLYRGYDNTAVGQTPKFEFPYTFSWGGQKNSAWDNLSMGEKSEMMKVAVKHGITNLSDIRKKYNEYAEGGDVNPYTVGAMVDAIYASHPEEEYLGEPSHHYDFTQSEEWANAHGYYPDARGHRDDRVKKPAHPSHPSRGTWDGNRFELTDFGMQNPNYTLFGFNDNGQDPQAVLTYKDGIIIPEITVTPNGNYIFNPYDNIKLHYTEGGTPADKSNRFADGGWLSWLTGLFKSEPKHYYKAADGRVYDSKDKAVNRNKELVASKQAYLQKENKATGVKRKIVMRKPNTSPTSEKSQELENRMYTKLDEFGARTGYRTKSYDIPYGDRTITVRPVGSPFSTELSVNALDTIAKYAGITGTTIQTAVGLPWHETKFGRIPYYNVGQKGNTFTNRELENANYFKNFGSIPAEYLVRDFRYNGDLVFDGRRDSPIPLSTPPLQHALEYLNAGKYNTKQPHHAQNVENAGNALWNETTGSLLNWWENEGKEWYNKNKYKNR